MPLAPEQPFLSAGAEVRLFTTQTCPNCRIARSYLDKAKILYCELVANEKTEMVRRYDIVQAPTLIVTDGAKTAKYVGADAIKQFVSQVMAASASA